MVVEVEQALLTRAVKGATTVAAVRAERAELPEVAREEQDIRALFLQLTSLLTKT